jgi:hypothetical protein
MESKLPTYRIMINEDDMTTGVDFISLVKDPAVEENWMAFSSVQFDFQAQKDKQMLFGVLMIPDKRIYRNDEKFGEYNVFFTKEDIEMVVKKFSKNNYNNNISFEHMGIQVKGTLVENFIIKKDMVVPGFESIPVGSWMGCVYIEDESFWTNFVKNDIVKGFSIEINGFLSRQDFNKSVDVWSSIMELLEDEINDETIIKVEELFRKYKFETYNDYPQAASDAAKRALKWLDESGNPNDCLTRVGYARAHQLANREPISRETIARMAAFERHRQNKDVPYEEGCGGIAWDCWGSDSGIEWAQRKLKQIDAALNSSTYQTIINKMSKEEFVVEPKSGETEDEFIGRCIAIEVDNGYTQDQAYAICKSKFNNRNNE